MSRLGTLTAAAGFALSSAAFGGVGHDPNLDEKIDVPDFVIDSVPNQGQPFVHTVQNGDNGNSIVGFSFTGTVSGITGNATWASDMKLVITDPNGGTYDLGGFSGVTNPWNFQGSGSTSDGTYSHGPDYVWASAPIIKNGQGVWTFTFTHDWNSTSAATMTWTDVSITFHKVPAPGAAALLGVAGLAGVRRRR